MKLKIILTILLMVLAGRKSAQELPSVDNTISGINELILTEQDLLQLGMTTNGTDCKIEEYQTGEYSSLGQYGICSYVISSLNNTEVIIELKKFSNLNDLNGSYQYESLHYRSSEGLISENDYGDQSRFYVNNENDYGGEFNDPNIYYYTLYATKDEYLIHVTSKGITKEAESYIAKTGEIILSKFG